MLKATQADRYQIQIDSKTTQKSITRANKLMKTTNALAIDRTKLSTCQQEFPNTYSIHDKIKAYMAREQIKIEIK